MRPGQEFPDVAQREEAYADDSVVADVVRGAVAGAVGVWVMDRVDWFIYEHEDPEARRQTHEARGQGIDPAHRAAGRIARAVGTDLSQAQPHPAGVAIHYSLGIGPGAIYGGMRDRVPGVGAGRGLLWGFGLFAIQDEIINAVSGLSGRPDEYPWQAHARGLVAHLVLGVTTDLAFSALKRWAR